nr:serine/threonine-protein kinase [Actinomycetota bacterium]
MTTYGAIRERYEPRAVVGAGAQGEVLCARDLVHDRLVALKVRHIGAGADREEMLAEARTLLNLRPHPGVALVREDFFVGDRYHMVMDWIDGVDLSRLLGEAGPAGLAFQRLLGYLTQVADAVDHLHRHDPPIVHKDLKPANIVIDASGRAVLVDFGISTGTRGLQRWSGTSGYVPPEIAAGGPSGPASDIFSLAATAYFAFTGVSPEPGARPCWRGVPEALMPRVEAALARGLALDPARRPATARALVELLAPPSVPHNLPAALTPFVGRQRELAHLAQTLDRTRLLSFVGSGGMGKTRLATELAGEVAWAYADGVWLVELAPVGADFVTAAVAKVLGVREAPGRTLLEAVADRLRDRQLLLVLDNCEHVLDAAAGVAEALLQGAPGLRILATSRQPLEIFGEVVHRVPTLSFPDAAVSQTLEHLASYEAVELFCGRAHAADPGFALGPETAGDVTEVCAVLDGTPLALEMAASRLRELSLPELAASLGDALELRGARTAPSRQRTLAATVAWSYNLLPASAAALFRRLSVFAGTFSLEAAQAVCGGDGVVAADVAELLRSLVERSMVVPEPGGESRGERHRLLETLRLYGQELSIDAGEQPWLVDRHVEYFLSLVDDAHGRLFGAEEADTLNKLDTETANFRLALGRALEDGQGEKALRLAVG